MIANTYKRLNVCQILFEALVIPISQMRKPMVKYLAQGHRTNMSQDLDSGISLYF